jgi:hypothetical protein
MITSRTAKGKENAKTICRKLKHPFGNSILVCRINDSISTISQTASSSKPWLKAR